MKQGKAKLVAEVDYQFPQDIEQHCDSRTRTSMLESEFMERLKPLDELEFNPAITRIQSIKVRDLKIDLDDSDYEINPEKIEKVKVLGLSVHSAGCLDPYGWGDTDTEPGAPYTEIHLLHPKEGKLRLIIDTNGNVELRDYGSGGYGAQLNPMTVSRIVDAIIRDGDAENED